MEPSSLDPVFAAAGSSTLSNRTVTPEAYRAVWGSAIRYAMDGFDLLILGFMLRQIGSDLNLNAPQAGSLVTVAVVGAVLAVWCSVCSRTGLAVSASCRRLRKWTGLETNLLFERIRAALNRW
jgi:hypothetical protein